MTVCIQCALEAFVKSKGETAATRIGARFDEDPEEHMRREHPDLAATMLRRRWLEEEAARVMGGTLVRPEESGGFIRQFVRVVLT